MTVDYAFSNSTPQAERQLSSLEQYLDPITASYLGGLAAPPAGSRCLELGPGAGSIARLLAELVGPSGEVLAVDRDPSRLVPAPNLRVMRHDLQDELPDVGQFSLIHARLLLVHLPNRRRLLQRLAESLVPGGWLAIGEFCFDMPLDVLGSTDPGDAALFSRVVETTNDHLAREHGVELAWSRHVEEVMAAAGLWRTRTIEHPGTWAGGDAGCQLLAACASQKHQQLLASGLTEDELQRFYELMRSPAFSCRSWPFSYALGQKPVAGQTIWVP